MKVLVLYNPYSSTQKISKNIKLVEKKLLEKYDEVEFFASPYPKSITEKIMNDGDNYDTLLVSGGDGTLNEAVTGCIKGNVKTPIAYIPSGTVNDVGQILKLKKNVKKGLDIALDGIPAKIDICKVNENYFVYVCAAGKMTDISYDIDYKLKKKWGKLAYGIRGVQGLTQKSCTRFRIITPTETTYSNCYIFFAFNHQQFGGFKFYRKKAPYLNDGVIDFTFIEKTKRFSLWRTIKFVLFGDRAKNGIRTITGNKIRLESDKEVAFNVDGELAFKGNACDIEVLNQAVSIIVPRKTYKKMLEKHDKKDL